MDEIDKIIKLFETLPESEKSKFLNHLGKKEFSKCSNCSNLCENLEACEFCIKNFLEKDFGKWTSGNTEIDELIKNRQRNIIKIDHIVEWIPFNKFQDVQFTFFSKRFK